MKKYTRKMDNNDLSDSDNSPILRKTAHEKFHARTVAIDNFNGAM